VIEQKNVFELTGEIQIKTGRYIMAISNGATDLAQIGATFSDATTAPVGGVRNTVNSGAKQNLINASRAQFQGLAGIHAETIVNRLNPACRSPALTMNSPSGEPRTPMPTR
jgi:hypothetical protein